jgi:hypothetical protein
LWVSPTILSYAQQLADLLNVDVDTFIELVVTSLHEHEVAEGQLAQARAGAKSPNGRVRAITGHGSSRLTRSRRRMQ